MIHTEKELKVAVMQQAPVLFDLEQTINKAIQLIEEAAKQDADLIVFPESFIPAYPRGLTFGFVIGSRSELGRKDWKRYYDNSVAVPSEATDRLAKAAKDNKVYLSIGITEKDSTGKTATLYCTNLIFSPEGNIISKHRKLKPTGSERYIWGEDDGSTLSVTDTPYGRMGSLICWENYMPLARVAMYEKGVTIYLAPTADSRDQWQNTMKHVALEGRCFVIGCNQYVEKNMYPTDLYCYDELEKQPEVMSRGGSCIVSPFGKYVAGPLFDREGILYATLDLDKVITSRIDFDVRGHYSRPDIFEFKINEK
jgi:nitrilase